VKGQPLRRYGLCGKNGAGKSTLLRLVALRRIAGLPSNLHILYVAQDTADKIAVGVGSALEAVVASDKLRTYLLQVRHEVYFIIIGNTLAVRPCSAEWHPRATRAVGFRVEDCQAMTPGLRFS
jgi:ABC-type glutathione transport system ATPase component